jgi:hypothetical protein
MPWLPFAAPLLCSAFIEAEAEVAPFRGASGVRPFPEKECPFNRWELAILLGLWDSIGGGEELMTLRLVSRSVLRGEMSTPREAVPGVPKAPSCFQKLEGPPGLESGMNFEGATSVLGGARRGFWRRGAGVFIGQGWAWEVGKGVSR